MANMKFANNANTTLASSLTAIATTMSVTSATKFPVLNPLAPVPEYFYCTLTDVATQTVIEIVKVTATSGTTWTITRGQDGTTGTAFAAGDVVSLRLVRASLDLFPKLNEVNTFTSAQTANSWIPSSSTVPTNGLYLPAANSIGFATNTTERMRINTSGILLINSTTPDATSGISGAKLQVLGGIVAGIDGLGSGGTGYIAFNSAMASAPTTAHPIIYHRQSVGLGIQSDYAISFAINGSTEAMRIDSSGNVAIGSTANYGNRLALVPAATPTTVAGANQIQIGEASANTAYRLQMGYYNDATAGYIGSIQSYSGGTATNLVINGGGGSIGVGTSNPAAYTTTPGFGSGIAITSPGNGGYLPCLSLAKTGTAGGGAQAYTIYVDNTKKLSVYDLTNSADRLSIFASGGVSIGNTTDPGATNLSVTGSIKTATWNGATIGTGYGGTGLTTVTANRIPYGNNTSPLNTSAGLTFDGTTLQSTRNNNAIQDGWMAQIMAAVVSTGGCNGGGPSMSFTTMNIGGTSKQMFAASSSGTPAGYSSITDQLGNFPIVIVNCANSLSSGWSTSIPSFWTRIYVRSDMSGISYT
jgi:hypothetical protein